MRVQGLQTGILLSPRLCMRRKWLLSRLHWMPLLCCRITIEDAPYTMTYRIVRMDRVMRESRWRWRILGMPIECQDSYGTIVYQLKEQVTPHDMTLLRKRRVAIICGDSVHSAWVFVPSKVKK